MNRKRKNRLMEKHRRDMALDRFELREPPAPRRSSAGLTAPAIKVMDPATRALIDAAIAVRKGK